MHLSFIQPLLVAALLAIVLRDPSVFAAGPRDILIFGGNGFLGAETTELFINNRDNVTIVNRGNWYWDSHSRIKPHVKVIPCDRQKKIAEDCKELKDFIDQSDFFDAVVDFSAYGAPEMKEAIAVLEGKVGMYILISTDSIYDVCQKTHDGYSKETDAVRPETADEVKLLSHYHKYGHNKLEAEEVLLQQRMEGTGFPFVILRLPDVIGPRDTTYRFWIYQIWVKLTNHIPEKPLILPSFLSSYPMSFVYSKDVAKVIYDVLMMGPQIKDQAINLGFPQTILMEELIKAMQEELGIIDLDIKTADPEDRTVTYLYPTVRKGPIDVSKAENLIHWAPTSFREAVTESVLFYEKAMKEDKFHQQRDEIIQIVGAQIYKDHLDAFYEKLEELYNIHLHHFKPVRDEL